MRLKNRWTRLTRILISVFQNGVIPLILVTENLILSKDYRNILFFLFWQYFMIKELWVLIKMLFASRPSSILRKDLELVVMKHFPFDGYRFMSWCGKVILRQERKEVIDRFLQTKAGIVSIQHEYGHAIQAESEHGDNWIRYYLFYFLHWIKHCPWMNPSSACYYLNRYEVEAYAQEGNPKYWDNYNRDNLHGKYSIRNAKKKWKEVGGSSAEWKRYIKSL